MDKISYLKAGRAKLKKGAGVLLAAALAFNTLTYGTAAAALDDGGAPIPLAIGDFQFTANGESVIFTEEECGSDCQGHIITQSTNAFAGRNARILVESGSHNITFSDLTLIEAKVGVMPGGMMNLTIDGTNSISVSQGMAGIYVPVDAALVITEQSTGSLNVSGSSGGAGIGGGFYDPDDNTGDLNCGKVIINGGTITAIGSACAAGIGGAGGDYDRPFGGNGGIVTINGGTVTATGGDDDGYYGGAGIGGGIYNGKSGSGGTLTINGGLVTLNTGACNDQWGIAYGFGRGSGSNSSAGTLCLADESCLTLADGTALDPNGTYYITSDPTSDMITVPTDMHYTSADMAAEIEQEITVSGKEICGQIFRIDMDGWNLSVTKMSDLEYTAVYTHADKGTVSKPVIILPCLHGDGTALTHHEKVEANCTHTGVLEYWDCSVCGKSFSDGDGLTEITDTEIPMTAHKLTHHEKTESDCTNDGTVEYWSCSECGRNYGDAAAENQIADITVSAKGHTEVIDAAVAATCTTDGKTEGKHCSVCGEILIAQTTVPAGGHSWDNGTVTTPATEDSEGVKTFTCSKCNEIKTEVIPPLGHIHALTHHAKADADCVNAGTIEYWSCSKCGNNYGDAAGENQITDITISAKGHTEVIDAAVAATCTADGKTEGKHCSVCGEVIKVQENVPAPGHAWNGGEVTKQPTETESGLKTFSCTVCGETKTEPIAPLNHTHEWGSDWSGDDFSHWHECVGGCGMKKDEAAHAWDSGAITKQPTETEAGIKTYTCTVCQKTKTESIPRLENENPDPPEEHTHTYSQEWSGNDASHWHAATCGHDVRGDEAAHNWDRGTVTKQPTATVSGEKKFECTVCGRTKTETLPATGGSGNQGSSGSPSKPTTPDEPQAPSVGSITADTQNGENAPKAELAGPLDKLADIVLTEADKEAAENGTDIKIILTVGNGTVPDSDKELVEAVCGINNFKIGEYFDVGLLKNIGGSDEKVTETSAPVKVIFDLSDALQRDGRKFSVIRVHNGETAVLPDLDDDDKTVTVETDRFSTYALVYSEKDAPDNENSDVQPSESDTPSGDSKLPDDETALPESDSNTPENNENPATGAAVSFVPLTALLAAVVVFTSRKKKD